MRKDVYNGTIILTYLTMIDSETVWTKIVKHNDKQADTIANIVDK